MSAFDDVRLPEDVERGARSGPTFQTSIVSMAGAGEQRNANWDQEKLTADISYGMMRKDSPDEVQNSFIQILDFFRARRGQHRGFRFRDWADYQARNTLLSSTDGINYQLTKRYHTYARRITRPVPGTLVVYANGLPLSYLGGSGLPGWSLLDKGILKFNAAVSSSVEIRADFDFDVPMRFNTDVAQVILEWEDAGAISSIQLVQIRE